MAKFGQHWYDGDGPRHFEGKDGAGTTLRDARRLWKAGDHVYPSVTAIGSVRAKPQLEAWKTEQAVLKTLDMPQERWAFVNSKYAATDWVKQVIRESQQEVYAKADEGTEIHDEIERHFSGQSTQAGALVLDCLNEHCGPQEWTAEVYVCDPEIGYGGRTDLHCYDWIIDTKSKDGDVSGVRGYREQAEQLAAYRQALAKAGQCASDARLANVFISRDRELWGTPEGVSFFEHTDDNAWNRFYHTLLLWQVCKKYGPLWEQLTGE